MPRFLPHRDRSGPRSGRERDEAYRLLRTNLEVALADLDRPTVIVTSPGTGEGKTQTTTELARSFALAGRRVVAVDLDLRRPTIHHAFGQPAEPGVSDIFRGRSTLPDAIRRVTIEGPAGERGLYLLPAGSPSANPPELIGTQRTAQLLDTLSEQADIVLIDSPPVLPVADTLVLARMAAGVLLVVNSGVTTYAAALRAKDTLVRNHARLLGIVLNRFDERTGDFQLGYGEPYLGTDLPVGPSRSSGVIDEVTLSGNGSAP